MEFAMRTALLRPRVLALPLALAACDDGSQRIGELERELETQRTSLESSQAETTTFRADLETARGELDAARGEIGAASNDRDAARADLDATRADLEGTRTELEAANARIGDLEGELKDTTANAGETIESFGQRVAVQIEGLQALGGRVTDDADLSSAVSALQQNAETLSREIDSAAAEIAN